MLDLPRVILAFYLLSLGLGLWVQFDARARLAGRPLWEPLVWGLGTVLALPVFLPLYLLGARAPDRSGMWGFGEMAGMAVFFALTVPLVAGLLGLPEGGLTLREISAVILVQNAGFVLLGVFGILVRYRLPAARLGLTTRAWATMLLLGALAGGVTIPVSTVSEQAAVEVVAVLEGREGARARAEAEHDADPLEQILPQIQSPVGIGWFLVLLAVVVPIGEELYFRGVVYGGLRARYGVGWAVLVSAVFFGLVHQQVIHFLPIALLGVVLALVYERTGSLLPAIAVHAVNNIVSLLARIYGWNA